MAFGVEEFLKNAVSSAFLVRRMVFGVEEFLKNVVSSVISFPGMLSTVSGKSRYYTMSLIKMTLDQLPFGGAQTPSGGCPTPFGGCPTPFDGAQPPFGGAQTPLPGKSDPLLGCIGFNPQMAESVTTVIYSQHHIQERKSSNRAAAFSQAHPGTKQRF